MYGKTSCLSCWMYIVLIQLYFSAPTPGTILANAALYQNPNVKPPFTYASLIREVLMTVSRPDMGELYPWILPFHEGWLEMFHFISVCKHSTSQSHLDTF